MSQDSEVVPQEETKQNSQGSIEDLAMVAADSSPLGKEREEQRRRFLTLCKKMNVTDQTKTAAWDLLSKISIEDSTHENESALSACSLFLAAKTEGKGHRISLSQLLKETRIKMIDFFEPLKYFITLLQLSHFDDQLKFLEKKFVVISILFQKYEKLNEQLFQNNIIGNSTPDKLSKIKHSESHNIFTFGWTLFLVSKGKLLPEPPDLLNSFHVLLCCINLLLIHAPIHLRKLSLPDNVFDENEEEINTSNSCISFLCQLCGANYSEVVKVNDQLFVPFLLMLNKNGILKLSEGAVPKNFTFTGLLDVYLSYNVTAISKEYDIMYYDTGDFDERLFIDQKEQIGTPSKVPSQTRSYYHLKGKGVQEEQQLMSPYKSSLQSSNNIPGSPMSTTLNTVNTLKQIVGHTSSTSPSPNLLRFFKSCNTDISKIVEDRVAKLTGILREEGGNEEQRIELGIKLYYKVLESMLSAEEARLKIDNFSTLLNHENFHRSLLACAMEIVLFAYKMTQLTFPYILEKFQLKPFDFCKIIESVVRHEPEIPATIIGHLSTIENKILESMAWEETSPLIPLIQDKQNQQNVKNTLLSPTKKDNRAQNVQGLASPSPAQRLENNSSNSSNNSGKLSHSLELFLRKVVQLASQRSKDICCRLQIAPKIYQQVWQAILHVLTDKSTLLINRHLDQIIMCSLYGVSRVNQLKDITFKSIIEQYKSQPQAASKVYREVLTSTSPNTFSDIISFYNSIFIPQLESFLLQFQSTSTSTTTSATTPITQEEYNSVLPMSPTKYSMQPHYSPKVIPNVNLYLSPMRSRQSNGGTTTTTTTSTSNINNNNIISSIESVQSSNTNATSNGPSTPTPKFLYSFGESPAKELQSINVSINAKSASKSKPKRLFFSENGSPGESASPILSDSPTLKRRHDDAPFANLPETGETRVKKHDTGL